MSQKGPSHIVLFIFVQSYSYKPNISYYFRCPQYPSTRPSNGQIHSIQVFFNFTLEKVDLEKFRGKISLFIKMM